MKKSGGRERIGIVTSMPRAERIHVFNEMARLNEVDFRVFYLRRMAYGRFWDPGELPEIQHDAEFIPEVRLHKHLYLSPGLLRKFQDYDPDLMIMTQYASMGMQMLMWRQSALRKPWVFWSEQPHVRFNDAPLVRSEILRSALRRAALIPLKYWPREVWGTGKRAVNAYEKEVRCRPPVKNLPYFADLDRFFAAALRRTEHDRIRFLFCGSLSLRKSADIVAESVSRLIEEGLDFELTVAGKGPFEENFRQPAMLEHVRLLGFEPLKAMPEIFASNDVLVFPSRHDGWGMTLMEGMASGQPVISTMQTGAAVDVLEDGVNGFLLPEATVEGVTAAMRKMILQPETVRHMGSSAQATARQYTHRLGARLFLDMIHSVYHQ